MVFKGVSGVDMNAVDLYTSNFTQGEFETAALNVTNDHHYHYKNRIILNWDNFNAILVSRAYLLRTLYEHTSS